MTRSWSAAARAIADSRIVSASRIAVSRKASAAAMSAFRFTRAMSGRPMFAMYSFLSLTSLMVKEMTSSPILSMSPATFSRIRPATISGCLTISSTVNWPTMPRRWPSIESRIRFSRSAGGLAQELLGRRHDALGVGLHLDLGHRLDRHRDALLGVQVLRRRHVERHQLQRQLVGALDHRPDDRAAALDDLRGAHAVDDQRLVRPDPPVQPGQDPQEDQQHDGQHDRHDDRRTRDEAHEAVQDLAPPPRMTPTVRRRQAPARSAR